MTLRVFQWASGTVGKHAASACLDRTSLELVGLHAYSSAKLGKDVGEILGRGPTGVKVTVKPKVTVVSCGAINSPGLLMRSQLLSDGRVGEKTWFHPVTLMAALFDHEVDAFRGAPQSVYSHHFIDRGPGKMGFFFEVPPVHPMLASTVLTGAGAESIELMSKLRNINVMIALHVDGLLPDEEGATVRLRDGAHSRYSIKYDLTGTHWEAFRSSSKEMAKLQFAAGAKEVRSFHLSPVTMKSVAEVDKLDAAPWEPVQLRLATAHQMGGCRMGKDPSTSVVDTHLRYHSLDNLFVVDGSVFPTSLGVNPQETIFGIARWAAGHIGQSVS